ncbi:MAG: hypothetical protein ACP5HJ_00205 [Candidatus Micrarchaeia archaeon]|jgi:small subunit ribosomal protein S3Ae
MVKEKKVWYSIIAPQLFNSVEVGETLAKDEKDLINRKVEVPLSDITNNPSEIYSFVVFRINKVDGNKAYTCIDSFFIPQPFVKSLARKRREVIKIVKDCLAKDTKVRIKAIVITPKISKAQEKTIRKNTEKILEDFTKDKNFEEIVEGVIKKEVYKPIIENASKIAPVQKFEVYKIEKRRKE